MSKKRSRRRVPARRQSNIERLLERGLLVWLGIGAIVAVVLIVMLVALLSPRSNQTSSSAGDVPTGTPRILAATVETQPVRNAGDAGDDIAIWVHPTEPLFSTILGTDKLDGGGISVYDLYGTELYFYPDGNLNNVDLRYNFPLAGAPVALVGVTKRSDPVSLVFYRVDGPSRSLVKAGEVSLDQMGWEGARGFAMYRSPVSGKLYAFVTEFGTNTVYQFELDGTSGLVTATIVRSFDVGQSAEGMAVDDEHQRLYVAEEEVGIWQYGAEPETGEARTLVDGVVATGGNLVPSIKGLAMYKRADGSGYLLASSQGGGNFAVYDRVSHRFIGDFDLVSGNGIDGVAGQDGIEVTNFGLDAAFPGGLFVTHDHVNSDGGNQNAGNQNYKYVPWELIANSFSPPLAIDPAYDPRLAGAAPGG